MSAYTTQTAIQGEIQLTDLIDLTDDPPGHDRHRPTDVVDG